MAVSDLERTTQFYTELGFTANGKPNNDLTSFVVGDHQLIMHFFIRDKLQFENKGQLADLSNGNEIIFTIGADSKAEVDQWATAVEKAGGNLISRPEVFGDNYYGFVFSDPDGHRFNIFFM